jgi:hypothetical protein
MGLIYRVQLRTLLRMTSFLLSRARTRSARLQAMLSDPAFVFQIQTGDGVAAHFALRDHRLDFHQGKHSSPTFVQHWVDSREAVSVMLNRDETEILRAMEDGRCRLQGSFLVGMWFNEAIKIARSA